MKLSKLTLAMLALAIAPTNNTVGIKPILRPRRTRRPLQQMLPITTNPELLDPHGIWINEAAELITTGRSVWRHTMLDGLVTNEQGATRLLNPDETLEQEND